MEYSDAKFKPEVQHRRNQRILGAFASSVVPGLGHLLIGKVRSGIIFLCALGILSLLYWPLRVPKSYLGMQS